MELRNTEANVSVFRSLDWFTILLYVLLVSAGAVSIYAASYDFDNASMFDFAEFSGKQFLWISLSLIIGCIILLLDYRIYETYAYPIYGIVILILIATIFLAPRHKGFSVVACIRPGKSSACGIRKSGYCACFGEIV